MISLSTLHNLQAPTLSAQAAGGSPPSAFRFHLISTLTPYIQLNKPDTPTVSSHILPSYPESWDRICYLLRVGWMNELVEIGLSCFYLFLAAEDQTQGLAHAKPGLYYWAVPSVSRLTCGDAQVKLSPFICQGSIIFDSVIWKKCTLYQCIFLFFF